MIEAICYSYPFHIYCIMTLLCLSKVVDIDFSFYSLDTKDLLFREVKFMV